MTEKALQAKVTLVGDALSGKTYLLTRFCNDEFPEETDPPHFDNCIVNVKTGSKTVALDLWDTDGHHHFDRLRTLVYPDTDVFVICVPIDEPKNFTANITKWQKEIRQHCPRSPIIIVATKIDLRDDPDTIKLLKTLHLEPIQTDELGFIAKSAGAFGCYECSAKTGEGVREAFDLVARAALKARRKCTVM